MFDERPELVETNEGRELDAEPGLSISPIKSREEMESGG
jgi:hypothetical protein